MTIHGTALLSICLLAGVCSGTLLGWSLGVDADIGGVGIAMLILVVGAEGLRKSGRLGPETQSGISYWSAMYIPIVVAMAASQHVMGALSGGLVAVVAGIGGVAACFAMVGLLSRQGGASGRREPAE